MRGTGRGRLARFAPGAFAALIAVACFSGPAGAQAPDTVLSSSPNPSGLGETVSFTARVEGAGTVPTGTVTFKDGMSVLDTIALGAAGGATAVAPGSSHTCALTDIGGVKCWGSNSHGQLGDGTTSQRILPVDVSTLTSGVVAIAAGVFHTCALTEAGAVKCWGSNGSGQLGNGTSTDSAVPVAVDTLSSGVAAISAGERHTCALKNTGDVLCWGRNIFGQLGTGSIRVSSVPVAVNGLSGVVAITAGANHSCAVTGSGAAMCWGRNYFGQIGNGSSGSGSNRSTLVPVPVSTLTSGVTAIAAGGNHTCALKDSGVLCWGYNRYGQLGNGLSGSGNNSPTPVPVTSLSSGVAAVSAGHSHTCALKDSGGVLCWGYNFYGNLGNNATIDSPTPVNVSTLASGAVAIAAGDHHTCAVTNTGRLLCWGRNYDGQIGDGTARYRAVPVDVQPLSGGISKVSVGGSHACALSDVGGVACWGHGLQGQLGNGSTSDSPAPVAVTSLSSGVTAIAAGSLHTCALRDSGVLCWGYNGQLGNNSTTSSPIPVPVSTLTSSVVAIAAGGNHTCALTTSGGVECWGYNGQGQLGNGSTGQSPIPVAIPSLASGVTAIAAGTNHTCALKDSGVLCWGDNLQGQLGNGSSGSANNSSTPVPVSTLTSGVVAIAAGFQHTCALNASGGVLCWGRNAEGQLGNGSGPTSPTPVANSTLTSGVLEITAGSRHTCARTDTGSLKCWGYNNYGALGTGTTIISRTPVDSLLTGATDIAAGLNSTCAVAGGVAKCWGYNFHGQLGDGSYADRSLVPSQTADFGAPGGPLYAAAQYSTATLAIGSHDITAQYSGDGAYDPATSPVLTQVVTKPATITTLVSSVNPSVIGQQTVLTATVTSASGTPAGPVKFFNGTNEIGEKTLDTSGKATLAVSDLPVGAATLTAAFQGSVDHQASTSADLSQTVGKGDTGVALSGPTGPSITGQTVTFTAEVTAIAPAVGTPGGTVDFKADGASIGTATLSGGTASVSTAALALGTRVITAEYTGGTDFNAATSASQNHTVVPPSTTRVFSSLNPSKPHNPVAFTALVSGGATGAPQGQLDIKNGANTLATATLGAPAMVHTLTGGARHRCAVTSSGGVNCWGANYSGQLGTGSAGANSLQPVPVTGLNGEILAVSSKGHHTCALNVHGGIQCWGENHHGQLGQGGPTASAFPLDVTGLSSPVVALSSGSLHNCALMEGGSVQCWGRNNAGQLGNGTTVDSVTPVSVTGLESGVRALSTGGSHACALLTSGGVKCWGLNGSGQLGTGDTASRTSAVYVSGLASGVRAIASGANHTCALMDDTTVRCWGANATGELGNGTTTASSVPVTIPSFNGVEALSAGSHFTCALVSGNAALCWGTNDYGQLGNPSITGPFNPSPFPVSGLGSGVAAIVAGSQHACALKTDGAAACWGRGSDGALGNGSGTNSSMPVDVTGFGAGAALVYSEASTSTDALAPGNHTITAAYSGSGSLGAGSSAPLTQMVQKAASETRLTSSLNPSGYTDEVTFTARVTSLGGGAPGGTVTFKDGATELGSVAVKTAGAGAGAGAAVAGGAIHSCALTKSGGVKCWGDNADGQLGNSINTESLVPIAVSALSNPVSAIATGFSHTCASLENAEVWCWGRNEFGQLGNSSGVSSSSPLPVIDSALTVAAGRFHNCALLEDGVVKCWGANDRGQLGVAGPVSGAVPVTVNLGGDATSLTSNNGDHNCALLNSGEVKCWGRNQHGQLGDGNTDDSANPVQVAGLGGSVTSIATGVHHTCALLSSGDVKCWGYNLYGQSGSIGTTNHVSSPELISNISDSALSVAAGFGHTCALLNTGSVQCWGLNDLGQLGNGSTANSTTPVTVSALGGPASLLIAGDYYNCALLYSGEVKCWGGNYSGQLGDSTKTNSPTPITVAGFTGGFARGSGEATFSTSTLAVGDRTITAAYSAGINHDPSTSAPLTQTVQPAATATALTSSVNPSLIGQETTLTATVTASAGTPAGTVKFFAGLTEIGSATLNGSGVATLGEAGLLVGVNTLTAEYQGNTNYAASTSGPLDQTVNPGATTTSLAASANPSPLGRSITLTATVEVTAPAVGTPSGTVHFFAGSLEIGNGPLDGAGKASIAVDDLPLGDSSLTASYAGTGDFSGSTALALVQTTGPAVTTTRLLSSRNASNARETVTLDAVVRGSGGGAPTGNLAFRNGTDTLDTVALSLLGAPATVAVGLNHACAINKAGGVECWGENGAGQLGYPPSGIDVRPVPVPDLPSGVASLAGSLNHTCALLENGSVKCWGANDWGQLGVGSTTPTHTPTQVSGLGSGVKAITSGSEHACALKDDGTVWCWGRNEWGQVGDGTATQRRTAPAKVSGLTSSIVGISAVGSHTCALAFNGYVSCWGFNSYGQIGDGTVDNRLDAYRVASAGNDNVAVISGAEHNCVLSSAGGLRCWGRNDEGQLGNNSQTSAMAPQQVIGLDSGVAAIAAGFYHTCATLNDGTVRCWGLNVHGQLGNGTTGTGLTPQTVTGLTSDIGTVAAYGHTTCATTAAGALKCWGSGLSGQLGTGAQASSPVPASVYGFGDGKARVYAKARYASGDLPAGSHTLTAAYAGGATHAASTSGPLAQVVNPGTTETVAMSAPNPSRLGEPVTFTARIAGRGGGAPEGSVAFKAGQTVLGSGPLSALGVGSAVAGGGNHTCALTGAGGVKCWGYNINGQLGDGTTADKWTPTDVNTLATGVKALSAGGSHTCVLSASGGVQCWGRNSHGALGNGTTIQQTAPVGVNTLQSGVAKITSGYDHNCALTTTGVVKCWGSNSAGALGDGTAIHRTSPITVGTLPGGIKDIAAGASHTCALTGAGSVKCWGYNVQGQLGNGSNANSASPVDVSQLGATVVAIATGGYHTCALTESGDVKCWGYNRNGQLGNGTDISSTTPVNVGGLNSDVVAIAANGHYTCALTGSGNVKCWGYNAQGQLGDGTTATRHLPVDVNGLNGETVAIHAGYTHACAQMETGGVTCWGNNSNGQLGDGTTTPKTIPTDVIDFGPGASLVYGEARFSTSALALGDHSITADFGGDDWHGSSVSPALVQSVEIAATATAFASSVNPSVTGQSTTLTATVTSAGGTPAGTVKFLNGTSEIGSQILDTSGKATLAVSDLPVGTTTLTAAYQGNGSFAASTSGTLDQMVNKGDTAVALSASAGSSVFGQPVTFTASVTATAPAAGTPGGSVTFRKNGNSIGTATLSGGSASITTSALDIGGHTITADYPGSTGFKAATSSGVGHSVGKGTASIALASSSNPADHGTEITLTATVGASAPASGTPGGTVTFFEGTRELGSTTLSGGKASLAIDDLLPGDRTITAQYTDGTAFNDATSAAFTQTINTAPSATTLASSRNPSTFGEEVTFSATVTGDGLGAPSGTVAFKTSTKTLGSALIERKAADGTIGAGGGHSCVVGPNGGVRCWGLNDQGQLGIGSNTNTSEPVAVSGLAGPARSLGGGANHTCILSDAGTIECWGDNWGGQLGNGSTADSNAPAGIPVLGNAVLLAVGAEHSCALQTSGTVRCWGLNGDGQVGDGSTANRTSPTPVSGLSGPVIDLATGARHSCALIDNGSVECWGANGFGELGNGSNTQSATPVQVAGLSGPATSVVGQDWHTCALLKSGGVQCWGRNTSGQLGDGSTSDRNSAVAVTGLSGSVVQLTAHGPHTCALMADRSVECWGDNLHGQLGDGTSTNSTQAKPVVGLSGPVVDIASGWSHTCALIEDGSSQCWGRNDNGQVGDGSTTDTAAPTPVTGLGPGAARVYGAAQIATSTLQVGGHTITAEYAGSDSHAASTSAPLSQTVGKAATATALASSLNPSAFGQETVLTATVTSGGGTPAGAVKFFSGTAQIGETTLDSSGKATLAVSNLPVGTATLTAAYQGNDDYQVSTSSDLDQTVNKAASSTVLASSVNPSVTGQSTTLTATVTSAGGTPAGPVKFLNGTSEIGSQTLDGSGKATLAVSDLSVGTTTLTAAYQGNGSFAASTSGTLDQMVNKGGAAVALSASAGSSVFGQPVTFTASVTATAPAAGTPGGSVTFRKNGNSIGTAALSGGSASITIAALDIGSHTITAEYSGSTGFSAATSSGLGHSVGKGTATVALTSSSTSTLFGEAVTFSATVAAVAPAIGTPEGEVAFSYTPDSETAPVEIGRADLIAGEATIMTSDLAPGSYRITAAYQGGGEFGGATSMDLVHTVAKGATNTALFLSAKTAAPGQEITLTATVSAVSPATGTPQGTVTFKAGDEELGTVDANTQEAALTVDDLKIGRHAITAEYGGSAGWAGSLSDGANLTVDPRGDAEFQINTHVAKAQKWPAMARLANGHLIAVWQSDKQDGSGYGIYGQRYDAKARARGKEFKVHTYKAGDQTLPVLAALADGGFVVAWVSEGQDGDGLGVFAQRFNRKAKAVGRPFRVNTTTAKDQTLPAVTGLANGNFVLVWQSKHQDGDEAAVIGQRYNSDGTVKRREFQVNTTTAYGQTDPAVATLAGGGFVAAWESRKQDGKRRGIFGQRFNATGRPKGEEFQINTTKRGSQTDPVLVALANGGFVAAWVSPKQDGDGLGVFAQRFNKWARPKGQEFQVHTTTARDQWQPTFAALPGGGFLALWASDGEDGDGFGIYARRYSDTADPIGDAFPVNLTTKNGQSQPTAVSTGDGAAVAAWTSWKQDGSRQGVFGIELVIGD